MAPGHDGLGHLSHRGPGRGGGKTGNGAPATSATLDLPAGLAVDNLGDVYLADTQGTQVRVIPATTFTPFSLAPAASAIDITQPDGSRSPSTRRPAEPAPRPSSWPGSYCTLPENISATLTYSSSGAGTYTYSPAGTSYTYNSSGALNRKPTPPGTRSPSPTESSARRGELPRLGQSCDTVTAASGRALVIGL